ncbi:MAG: hypothetical protein GF344_20215, partial [Chitinivibrionales bacterium]|nr:hypothetical protein [Chitinivibrionales bacterium]MBD3358938.1 hypothetical protein [Chitinivibrionales bacterium]
MNLSSIACIVVALAMFRAPVFSEEPDTARLWIDVKEVDISDAVRMISRANNLSVVLDSGITGKVTLHLSDAPVMEGLESLARAHQLEVVREGTVYRLRRPIPPSKFEMSFRRGRISIDMKNIDVKEFVATVAEKAHLSIVMDNGIEGNVSGILMNVPVQEGLRAILHANGFRVASRGNVMQVLKSRPLRHERKESGEPGDFFVEASKDLISVDVTEVKLSDVIQEIANQSGMELVVFNDPSDVTITARFQNVPPAEALDVLFGGTRYAFAEKGNIILVGQRRRSQSDMLNKTVLLPLKHIKAEVIPSIAPQLLRQLDLKVVKEQNAILLSGPSEDLV